MDLGSLVIIARSGTRAFARRSAQSALSVEQDPG
jgi:hypothetical protein